MRLELSSLNYCYVFLDPIIPLFAMFASFIHRELNCSSMYYRLSMYMISFTAYFSEMLFLKKLIK